MKIQTLALTASLFISGTAFATDVLNHKSPYCGCCTEWTKHMQEAGFTVEEKLHENMNPIKQKLGITPELASCHTAEIDGYVFEGHIPAQDVKDFLDNPPRNAKGLAVPGMPLGSPGMEYGDKQDSYTVYAFDNDGNVIAFAQH
jgi:hypothetical protein